MPHSSDDPDERSGDAAGEHSEGEAGESPRPARSTPRPARAGGPVPVRGSGPDDDGPRPVPVREAMEAERVEREPVPIPSVRFHRGDEEWIARVEGRTTAGFRGDGGAPLLFLTFARANTPEKRVLEAVAVARALDDLGPGDLGVLVHDARPFRASPDGAEIFPETRKSRR